jgi:hypothetical protein
MSMSFGAFSLNLENGKFDYLFDSDNSFLENLGYSLGALNNINDAWNAIFPSSQGANLNTEANDMISHSSWTENGTDNSIISFGPDKDNWWSNIKGDIAGVKGLGDPTLTEIKQYEKFLIGLYPGNPDWPAIYPDNWQLTINNINRVPLEIIGKASHYMPYNALTFSCSNVAWLGSLLSGIPCIGIHPYILYGTTWLYKTTRYDLLNYFLNDNISDK